MLFFCCTPHTSPPPLQLKSFFYHLDILMKQKSSILTLPACPDNFQQLSFSRYYFILKVDLPFRIPTRRLPTNIIFQEGFYLPGKIEKLLIITSSFSRQYLTVVFFKVFKSHWTKKFSLEN